MAEAMGSFPRADNLRPEGGGERGAVHDHIVGFYERDDELVSTAADFLTAALEGGGAAIVIATAAHRSAFDAALRGGGFSIADLTWSGRYQSLDAEQTLAAFMRDNRPDPVEFASVIGGALDGLRGDGPVHAFGEMVALLWDAGNVEAAIELESLWNDLANDHTFSLYCAYAMSSLESSGDLAAAKQVCDRHSVVVPLVAIPEDRAEGAMSEGVDEFARLFVPAPVVVREVRAFVREVLRHWGEDARGGEAEVIVAELAANAVAHARSPFRVSISRSNEEIKIAVRDACMLLPQDREADSTANAGRNGGRGISIVASLSSNWDTQPETDGKTIWATMTRSI